MHRVRRLTVQCFNSQVDQRMPVAVRIDLDRIISIIYRLNFQGYHINSLTLIIFPQVNHFFFCYKDTKELRKIGLKFIIAIFFGQLYKKLNYSINRVNNEQINTA